MLKRDESEHQGEQPLIFTGGWRILIMRGIVVDRFGGKETKDKFRKERETKNRFVMVEAKI